jgi:hypothetical protein
MDNNFRDEIIRKLPQKVFLQEYGPPPLFWWIISIATLIFLTTTCVYLFSRGMELPWIIGLLLAPFVAILTISWLLHQAFRAVHFSLGLYPHIEYVPTEQMLIIHDLRGLEALFNPTAELKVHVTAVRHFIPEKTPDDNWVVVLETIKGERFPIHSSAAKAPEAVAELIQRIQSMLFLESGNNR